MINYGSKEKAAELFSKAYEIEDQLMELQEALEKVSDIIDKLTSLSPIDALEDYQDDEW